MSGAGGNLPALVPFSAYGDCASYLAGLYAYFEADFITSTPSFESKRWAVKRQPLIMGKEATFWHIISRADNRSGARPAVEMRCERIRWPRAMIDRHRDGSFRVWQNTRGRSTRILIALPDFSYVTILEDRGSYVMLWTAYCVDGSRRKQLRAEYSRLGPRP